MALKLYVGNLPYSVQDQDLADWVVREGFEVDSARVIRDRTTGQPRGFGFVELAPGQDINQAIERLNGSSWDGRTLQVNEARPEERRPGGGFGGGGGGRGGDFRGGRGGDRGGRDRGGRGDRGARGGDRW